MKIERILNNNSVVVLDPKSREMVVMGKGIAFHRPPGTEIPSELIEKIFPIMSPEANSRLQEVISDIPLEHIRISEKVITRVRGILGRKLSDTIYITLTDHISSALTRYHNGITFPNPFLWDIKHYYPDEMEAGKEAILLINRECGTELSEEEASFIALHLVNAQIDESIPFVQEMTKLIQSVANIVQYYFFLKYDTESLAYYRFVNHLKFFAQRIMKGEPYQGDYTAFLEMAKAEYPESCKCAGMVASFIKKQHNYIMTEEEILYMSVHIERVRRECADHKQESRV